MTNKSDKLIVAEIMQIQVNGELVELADEATLMDLINKLALEGKRYAIEVNEEIVARSEHEEYSLSVGDQVEVVQAIGGG